MNGAEGHDSPPPPLESYGDEAFRAPLPRPPSPEVTPAAIEREHLIHPLPRYERAFEDFSPLSERPVIEDFGRSIPTQGTNIHSLRNSPEEVVEPPPRILPEGIPCSTNSNGFSDNHSYVVAGDSPAAAIQSTGAHEQVAGAAPDSPAWSNLHSSLESIPLRRIGTSLPFSSGGRPSEASVERSSSQSTKQVTDSRGAPSDVGLSQMTLGFDRNFTEGLAPTADASAPRTLPLAGARKPAIAAGTIVIRSTGATSTSPTTRTSCFSAVESPKTPLVAKERRRSSDSAWPRRKKTASPAPSGAEHFAEGWKRLAIEGAAPPRSIWPGKVYSNTSESSSVEPLSSSELCLDGSMAMETWNSHAADEQLGEDTVCVAIHAMSPLHPDLQVVHPFVRVWVVDAVDGNTLTSPGMPTSAMTFPFDIRHRGCRAPLWDAEVTLTVRRSTLEAAGTDMVVLLEVLDFGSETMTGLFVPRDGLYPICWGFLDMADLYHGRSPTGRPVHLQLYPFPQRTPWYTRALQSLLPNRLSDWGAVAATSYQHLAQWRQLTSAITVVVPAGPVPKTGALSSTAEEEQEMQFPARPVNAIELHHQLMTREPHEMEVKSASEAPHRLQYIPEIFYVFRDARNRRIRYDAGLTVSLKIVEGTNYVSAVCSPLEVEEQMYYELERALFGNALLPDPSSLYGRRISFASTHALQVGWQQQRQRLRGRPDLAASTATFGSHHLHKSYIRQQEERVNPPTVVLHEQQMDGSVSCMSLSSSDRYLAVALIAGLSAVIQLRDLFSQQLEIVAVLRGHANYIHSICFSPDDALLLSCSADNTAKLWPVGECLATSLTKEKRGAATQPTVLSCICTLPHSAPVYCGIFHGGHVLTGGYSTQLSVWGFEDPLEAPSALGAGGGWNGAMDSVAAASMTIRDRSLSLLRTVGRMSLWGSIADMTTIVSPSHRHPNQVVRGKLTATVPLTSEAFTLAIRVADSRRVWTLDSVGNVVAWRAVYAEVQWEMSVRQRFACPGASTMEITQNIALVACPTRGEAYVIDTHQYIIIQHITGLPVHRFGTELLPDGRGFVQGNRHGRLLAYDCFTGDLFSALDGCPKLQVNFTIFQLKWAKRHHICVLCSGSLATLTGTDGDRGASQFSKRADTSTIVVAGAPRDENPVILEHDVRAEDYVRALFGGVIVMHQPQSLAVVAARPQKSDRIAFRGVDSSPKPGLVSGKNVADAETIRAAGTHLMERSDRINQIVAFWRGLVEHHKHLPKDREAADEDGGVQV